jgi:Sugar (and other) transporter
VGAAYWIYGVMAILAAVFTAKMVPETKGCSLEHMETMWLKTTTFQNDELPGSLQISRQELDG